MTDIANGSNGAPRGGFWGNANRPEAPKERETDTQTTGELAADSPAEDKTEPQDEAPAAEPAPEPERPAPQRANPVFEPVPQVMEDMLQQPIDGAVPGWMDPAPQEDLGSTGELPRVVAADIPEVDLDEPQTNASASDVLQWDDDTWEEGDEGVYTLGDAPTDDDLHFHMDEDHAYEGESTVYDEAEPVETKKGASRELRIAAVCVSVVAALALVYGLGVRRFSTRLLPNTFVNGLDISALTADEARDALVQQTTDYTCKVTVGDFSTTVSGAEIGLARDEEGMLSAATSQQSAYAWPLALVSPTRVEVDPGVTFNEEALRNKLSEAVSAYNEETIHSNDAAIVYNEDEGSYELVGSATGTAVDAGSVTEAVAQDLQSFSATSSPSEEAATHEATVHDIPSYHNRVENVNRARSSEIAVQVNGETVITADPDQNAQWVWIGEDSQVGWDEDSIRYWAKYWVADAVYHRDDWNYYYLDEDAFVQEMVNRLTGGVVDPFEAPVVEERSSEGRSRDYAYERGGWDESMGRYIDVDLEAQFARLFDENGEVLWESATVTGSMYENRPTVTGTFEIYEMTQGTTLVGFDYDNDGKPDYESYVYYWMPFYGGYGLHDATWRSTFGGDLYQYDGSHGCVNLPYDKAEELFNLTHIGEKVNVHW